MLWRSIQRWLGRPHGLPGHTNLLQGYEWVSQTLVVNLMLQPLCLISCPAQPLLVDVAIGIDQSFLSTAVTEKDHKMKFLNFNNKKEYQLTSVNWLLVGYLRTINLYDIYVYNIFFFVITIQMPFLSHT